MDLDSGDGITSRVDLSDGQVNAVRRIVQRLVEPLSEVVFRQVTHREVAGLVLDADDLVAAAGERLQDDPIAHQLDDKCPHIRYGRRRRQKGNWAGGSRRALWPGRAGGAGGACGTRLALRPALAGVALQARLALNTLHALCS